MKIRSLLSIIFLLLLAADGYWSQSKAEEVRLPAFAGTPFYPASPTKLRKDILKLLNSVSEIKPAGKILAAVAPHAGYDYSGGVAAYTHKLLSAVNFDTLIIIGHDSRYEDIVAFTCPVDYFQTPLGKVRVDREMMEKILQFNTRIKASRLIFTRDHTIEVQLPFLQGLGRKCEIIPFLFGRPTVDKCRVLTKAILAAAGDKTVFVLASADMSHYPPYDLAYKVDNATLEVLKSLDADRLFTHLAVQEREASVPNLDTTMCAKGGVGTAILFARAHGADHTQILRYANSGDVPGGDKRGVVGYSSVLMLKKAVP